MCGKATKVDKQLSVEELLTLELLLALEGVCWDMEQEVGSRDFLQVCIGQSVRQYSMTAAGAKSMMRVVGTSDSKTDVVRTLDGVSETFRGDGGEILVSYVCSRRQDDQAHVTHQSRVRTEVVIPTFLVCPSLDDSEIGAIIESIPAVAMLSSNMFWEYHYMYPSSVFQRHRDPTGATQNESYSLGSESTGELMTDQERSMDPDKLFIHPHIDMKLTGGTLCEAQKLQRQTTVQFRCPLDWHSADSKGWREHYVPLISAEKAFRARLADVREPEICEYEIIVETTALCIDPGFVPTQFEVSSHSIRCLKIRS